MPSGFGADAVEFLERAKIPLRLAAIKPSGWPAVISLWFVLMDGKLWCATQSEAKIVSYVRAEPRCAFEVAPDQPPYRGVRGSANAVINEEQGEEILRTLLDRYLGGTDSPLAHNLLSKAEDEVAIEIRPVSIHTWDYRKRMESSLKR
jgi:hypothetical protein